MLFYFIAYSDEDGTSFDWFVRAETPEAAMQFWIDEAYFHPDPDLMSFKADPEGSVKVFTLPTDQTHEGVLDWDHLPKTCFSLV